MKANRTPYGPWGGALALTVLVLLFAGAAAAQDNGDVKFRGNVTTAEQWGDFVCYGSYYVSVQVTKVLDDPLDLLEDTEEICYSKNMDLKIGEKVEVYGYAWKGTAPLQCAGRVDARDDPYYVARMGKEGPPVHDSREWYVYNAKFLCGRQSASSPVVAGNYATTINLHKWEHEPAYIHKKAVIAVKQHEPQLPYGFGEPFEICWDNAVQIDCPDIESWFPPGTASFANFTEGFVSIISPVPLDVVAVYTAQSPSGDMTMDVEKIEPNMIRQLFRTGDWPEDWPLISGDNPD